MANNSVRQRGMPKSITLFSKGSDLLPAHPGPIGFMFECAHDGLAYQHYPQAIPLNDLIGDFNETKAKAFRLTRKLLVDEPECRGVQQLSIFEELVIYALQRAYHILHLHEYLLNKGFTQCHFISESPLTSGLTWLAAYLSSNLTVSFSITSLRKSRWGSTKRIWQHLCATGFSQRAIFHQCRQVLERIDPYHRVSRLGFRKSRWVPNAIWFYTVAYTYTLVGLLYEPYFPQTFQYLVENPLSGGIPLHATGRPYTSIYEFGQKSMEPSAAELRTAQEIILSHLNSVSLSESEGLALRLLLNSPFFQFFLSHHLPRGLFSSALFEYWAASTCPAALVVGNPVYEGYALHAARRRGIPTILLAHSILGDFSQFSDPPVDHFIVRGSACYDFLAATPRSRAIILNPPSERGNAANPVTKSREAILFLTAGHEFQEFHHKTDLDEILGVLLTVAAEQDRELIMRVHPLEDIGYYQKIMSRQMQNDGGAVRITYSQGPGLDELLERSAVAVMYASTVFLDCLRLSVPVVSFAWHDYSYTDQIKKHGAFNFANNLSELRDLVKKSLHAGLPAYSQDARPFLADTPEEVLREHFTSLIQSHVQGTS